MTFKQRVVLVCGLVVLLGMVLYPPWLLTQQVYGRGTVPVGREYCWVFAGKTNGEIAWGVLVVQLVALAVLTGLSFFMCRWFKGTAWGAMFGLVTRAGRVAAGWRMRPMELGAGGEGGQQGGTRRVWDPRAALLTGAVAGLCVAAGFWWYLVSIGGAVLLLALALGMCGYLVSRERWIPEVLAREHQRHGGARTRKRPGVRWIVGPCVIGVTAGVVAWAMWTDWARVVRREREVQEQAAARQREVQEQAAAAAEARRRAATPAPDRPWWDDLRPAPAAAAEARRRAAAAEARRQVEAAAEARQRMLDEHRAKWRQLRQGMSKAEVEDLLGKPDSVRSYSAIGDVWGYPSPPGTYRILSVDFSREGLVKGWRGPE